MTNKCHLWSLLNTTLPNDTIWLSIYSVFIYQFKPKITYSQILKVFAVTSTDPKPHTVAMQIKKKNSWSGFEIFFSEIELVIWMCESPFSIYSLMKHLPCFWSVSNLIVYRCFVDFEPLNLLGRIWHRGQKKRERLDYSAYQKRSNIFHSNPSPDISTFY